MPDLFQPLSHVDGENYTAAQVNRLENGLEAVDVALDAQTDRIDALYASGGAGGAADQVPSGTLAALAATAPSIGSLFLIKDTAAGVKKLVVGTGEEWINPDGTAVGGTGGSVPGTTTAPVLSATVTAGGTIGAINLTWTAVSGATAYNVYETTSPNGVSGATGLTTTSSTRTPSTARNYDYWVTAIVGGVESAASNHIQATLPYVAPGGGGGGGTASDPSTLLNLNGLGTGVAGQWNLGVGLSTGHVDIDPNALKTYVNSPYYTLNSTGTAVQFQVFCNGGRTSSSTKYPRSELREYAAGSTTTKAAWNAASGTHHLAGKTRVMHYAPIKCEIVVAQIHDDADDNLQIRAEASSATGTQTWRLSINGTEVKDLISGVTLGAEVAWDIALVNGVLTTKINGSTVDTRTPGYASKSAYYFKAGCYIQFNSTDQANPATEYGRIELRDLICSHS